MGTSRTTLQMVDKVTPTLIKINKAMYETLKVMKQMNTGQDFSKMQQSITNVNKSLQELKRTQISNGKNITDNTKKIKQQATAWEQVKSSLAGQFAIGNLVTNFIWGAINAIKKLILSSINYASSLVEVQNVVDVAYGKSSKEVDAWAKTTLKSYGINELGAKKYAGTLASQLRASGMAQKQAGKMAMSLTGLAGDIASFYNIDIDTAFSKLRSGMSGMVVPLRKLGIDLTVATLQEYAYTQGINKKWKAMTQAEKTLIRYNYLMQVTKPQQGDFIKTQYTFANQLRLVQQNWEQLTGAIASGFLPIMNLALIAINKVLEGLQNLGNFWNTYLLPLAPIFLTIAGVIIASFIPALVALISNLAIMGGVAVSSAIAGFMALTIMGAPVWAVIAGITALIAVLNLCGVTFGDVAGVAVGAFQSVLAIINNVIVGVKRAIATIGALVSVAKTARETNMTDSAKEKLLNEKISTINKDNPYTDVAKAYKTGHTGGKKWGDATSKAVKQAMTLQTHFTNKDTPDAPGGGGGKPDGSKGKPLYTKLDENDINVLVDIAKVNYVNRFVRMQPTITANFGDVHETADVNGLISVIADELESAHFSSLTTGG